MHLITGSSGQLGQYFHSIQNEFPYYKLLFASYSEVYINQIETQLNYFENFPFEVIINCAENTYLCSSCLKNDEIANKINIDCIRTIIKFAKKI